MNEQPRPWFGVRDALWLAVIVMAALAWAWDRTRLATEVEKLGPMPPSGVGAANSTTAATGSRQDV